MEPHTAPVQHPHSPSTIRVTVDKSHLVTIGERLYTESIELIRELVNNAYDADATRVEVLIQDDEIVISDNGSGMDMRGLQRYFAIGSSDKKTRSKSPLYHRDRIGQFGIGKFSSLTACQQFEVVTQKGAFRARVVFDKNDWEKSPHSWELPLNILVPEPGHHDGTTVILRQLIRTFDPDEIRRRLVESVPLKAPHFEVFLNDERVTPRYYAGHRIGILEASSFGPVTGEIIILPASQIFDDHRGIEIRVKQVTVCRETFGLEDSREMIERLRGEVNADFLPVTSDRSGFVRDSAEFQSFLEVMQRVAAEIRRSFAHLSGKQEKRKASRALNEALERITAALTQNPEFAPFGMLPSGSPASSGSPGSSAGTPGAAEFAAPPHISDGGDNGASPTSPKPVRKKRVTVKKLTPDAVVKRLRMGSSKLACCLDHFGPDGPECQTQGNVIYINRDHSLYLHASRSPTAYTWHLARLLTQEITLMKPPSTPKQAFLRQSRLLKAAFEK